MASNYVCALLTSTLLTLSHAGAGGGSSAALTRAVRLPALAGLALAWHALGQVSGPIETIANYFMPECPLPGCPVGTRCTVDQQAKCESRICRENVAKGQSFCTLARCDDGLQNSWETGRDCGGACSRGCADGSACFAGQDCANSICLFRNAYEDFVTAGNPGGGICAPWTARCSDGVANGPNAQGLSGKEPDIDCGDPCCTSYKVKRDCPSRCNTGLQCNTVADCATERCFKNQKEGGARFCAAPRVSEIRTEYGTRIQGAVTVYGPKKLFFDPAPAISALSFMLDVQESTVVMDALVDVQGPREFGPESYTDLRYAKGWEPEKTPTLQDVDADRRLRGGGGGAVRPSGGAATPSSVTPPTHVLRPHGTGRVDARRGLSPTPRDDSPWRVGGGPSSDSGPTVRVEFVFGAGTHTRAGGGLGTPGTDFERAMGAKYGTDALERYQVKSVTLAHASAAGLPWAEVGGGLTTAEFLGAAAPTRPGGASPAAGGPDPAAGGPDPRALQTAFIPQYNLTTTDTVVGLTVRYMVYAQPFEALMVADRMTSVLDVALLPGGWPAERVLQDQLNRIAEDREFCITFAVNYTLAEFNMTGVNCTLYLSPEEEEKSSSDTKRRLAQEGGGGEEGAEAEEDLVIRSPLDTSWLTHPAVRRALVSHVRAACGVGASSPRHCPASAYTTLPMHSTYTGEARTRRRLEGKEDFHHGEVGGEGGLRIENSNPRLPRRLQLGVPSSSAEAAALLAGIPRVKLGDMFDFYGLGWDRGGQGLAPSVGGEGAVEPPPGSAAVTDFYNPATISVQDSPKGTPDQPLYDNVIFPIQPSVMLLDRHGRQVVKFRVDIRVTAELDPTVHPLDGPLQLTGFKAPLVRDGLAAYTDLLITQNVTSVSILFSSTFLTPTQQRVALAGATRPFRVVPQPPRPIIIFIRTPMNPIVVLILLLVGGAGTGFAFYSTMRGIYWMRTPGRRAEMVQPRETLDFDTVGDDEAQKDAGLAFYRPNLEPKEEDLSEEPEAGGDEEPSTGPGTGPVPLFTAGQLPGVGVAFTSAFSALDAQLGDLEDGPETDDEDAERGRYETGGGSDPGYASSSVRTRSSEEADMDRVRLPVPLTLAVAAKEVDRTLRMHGLMHPEPVQEAPKKSWFSFGGAAPAPAPPPVVDDSPPLGSTLQIVPRGQKGGPHAGSPAKGTTSTSSVLKRWSIGPVSAEEDASFRQGGPATPRSPAPVRGPAASSEAVVLPGTPAHNVGEQ